MTSVIVALVWACALVYAAHRLACAFETGVATFARAAWPAPEEAEPLVVIPDDLAALAMQYDEEWAQEDVLKAMRERFEQRKDWNLVRQAYGVAPTDEATT